MKTLSNDCTVTIDTSDIYEGYVSTVLYANSVGVFSGHSYVTEDLEDGGEPLNFNLNEISAQNRNKDDYLKLDDTCELHTISLEPIPGQQNAYTRFNKGQIDWYSATVLKSGIIRNSGMYILTGYDYPNIDIRPSVIDDNNGSEIGRIMQGCNWHVIHDDEIGTFSNLLLPHIPACVTNKFGIGLQLYRETVGDVYDFELRTPLNSSSFRLGRNTEISSMTFITNSSLYESGIYWPTDSTETPLYLKFYGISGDEWGDWEEGYDYYPGYVGITTIQETVWISGRPSTTVYNREQNPEGFRQALEKFIANSNQLNVPDEYNNIDTWNVNRICANYNEPVYKASTKISVYATSLELAEWKQYYEGNGKAVNVDGHRISLSMMNYIDTAYQPSVYYGNCPIAIIDGCYSRYYLAWNDRYGDIMSQAFNGKIIYSESFKTDEILDYKQKRRVYHNTVLPKWKLNTKWLNEDIYPMYESIFTSPYLLLYDTLNDRAWNVIVKNSDYKEKTFNTEKTLFNLEIDVEANTKQNFIY